MRKNKGFSVVEVVIVVVVVGVIATLGVVGYNRWKQAQVVSKDDTAQQADAATVPDVKTTTDLDKALSTLDQADVAGTDTTQLDSQSSAF